MRAVKVMETLKGDDLEAVLDLMEELVSRQSSTSQAEIEAMTLAEIIKFTQQQMLEADKEVLRLYAKARAK